jgi:hypothetical protein
MDTFVGICNKVVTECGHAFHCSCLMQNVSHNGFSCPYCREKMADEIEEEDEDDAANSIYSDDEEEHIYGDYALTSLRMFSQRINGEDVEEEVQPITNLQDDTEDWETVAEEVEEVEEAEEVEEVEEASSSYITEKLNERGITYEDLVKSLLDVEHDYTDFSRRSAEVYGQFRIIITQYGRNQRDTRRVNTRVRTLPNNIEEVKPNLQEELPLIAEAKITRIDVE